MYLELTSHTLKQELGGSQKGHPLIYCYYIYGERLIVAYNIKASSIPSGHWSFQVIISQYFLDILLFLSVILYLKIPTTHSKEPFLLYITNNTHTMSVGNK